MIAFDPFEESGQWIPRGVEGLVTKEHEGVWRNYSHLDYGGDGLCIGQIWSEFSLNVNYASINMTLKTYPFWHRNLIFSEIYESWVST